MKQPNSSDTPKPVLEHLLELRSALLRCFLAFLIAAAVCWLLREHLLEAFIAPLKTVQAQGIQIVALRLTDVLTAHLQIAFWGGIALSAPYILVELWRFVAPGLYRKERLFLGSFLFAGTVFFVGGVLLAYKFALPAAIEFLVEYSASATYVELKLELARYIGFAGALLVGTGVLAEIPLFMVLSCLLGFTTPDWFAKKRGLAIIALAVLSALMTPPDPLSMLIVLVPMVALYEGAIWVARLLTAGRNPQA